MGIRIKTRLRGQDEDDYEFMYTFRYGSVMNVSRRMSLSTSMSVGMSVMVGMSQNVSVRMRISTWVTFFKGPLHLLNSPFELGFTTGTVQLMHLHLAQSLLIFRTQVWVVLYGSHLSLDPLQILHAMGPDTM